MNIDARLLCLIIGCLVVCPNSATDELPKKIQDDIKRHAYIAAGSALIPVLGASAAANIANVCTMFATINADIGVKYSINVLKTVASGVVTNLGHFVTLLIASELLKFIPGVGSFTGAAIESGVAYAITVTSACVYLKAITLMAQEKIDFSDESNLKYEVEEVFRKDQEEIKDIFKEARKSYKA